MGNMYTDGSYLRQNKDWHVGESSWKAGKVLNTIRKNNLVFSSVCDVGCGYGRILKIFSDEFGDTSIQYTGYDVAPEAIVCAKEVECENITFFNKDILKETVKYDLIMALDVVEHIEDYFTFLRELKDKATYKLLHIPLGMFVLKVLHPRMFLKERHYHGHIHYFNKEIILAVLKELDYQIIDYEFLAKRLEVPHPGKTARYLRVPRAVAFKINKDMAARVLGGFSLSVLAR